MINNGFTPDKEDYEFCTKVDNMIIPSEGFFGISAATGGLAGIVNISKFERSTKKAPQSPVICSEIQPIFRLTVRSAFNIIPAVSCANG